jgi:hypothetical protein
VEVAKKSESLKHILNLSEHSETQNYNIIIISMAHNCAKNEAQL